MSPSGLVLSVNVSPGGVPKLPVEEAWVGRLGLAGDGHNEPTVHGGPHRAVCLYSVEAIERLQAEGHPVEPGSVGENLTTAGVEWSLLPVGTRARIGREVLLELADSTTPCSTQRHNFRDGRFSRISIELHPSDSRMYARVLAEGVVRPGDEVELLPPAGDSRAMVDLILHRIDPVESAASLRLWAAALAAGSDVAVLHDGELCAGASATLPSRAFNHAHGMRTLPHLLPQVLAHFDRAGSRAAVVPHVAPSPGAQPVARLAVHVAEPARMNPADLPAGVEVAPLAPGDAAALAELVDVYAGPMEGPDAAAWRGLLPHLVATRDVHSFLARIGGEPVGVGFLHLRRKVGLVKGAFVAERARGRGAQRALIAARVRAAADLGCELVTATAEVDSGSARNLERAGLTRIDAFPLYEYVPADVVEAAGR